MPPPTISLFTEYYTALGTLTAANTLGGQDEEEVGNPTAFKNSPIF